MIAVSRGGADQENDWISTSQLRNAAKANFTLEELGWQLRPAGSVTDWDGLTGWFLKQARVRSDVESNAYLHEWYLAAKAIIGA